MSQHPCGPPQPKPRRKVGFSSNERSLSRPPFSQAVQDSLIGTTDDDLYGPEVPTLEGDDLHGQEVPSTADCCTEGTRLWTDVETFSSRLTLRSGIGTDTEVLQKDNLSIFAKASQCQAATDSAHKHEIDQMHMEVSSQNVESVATMQLKKLQKENAFLHASLAEARQSKAKLELEHKKEIEEMHKIQALEKHCLQQWSVQLAGKEEDLKRRESDLYFREQWMQKWRDENNSLKEKVAMLELRMEDIKQHVVPNDGRIGSKKRVMPDCATRPPAKSKPDIRAQTGCPPPDPVVESVGHQMPQPRHGLHTAPVEGRQHIPGCFRQDGTQELVYQPHLSVEEQAANERSWSGMTEVQMTEYMDPVGPTALQLHVRADPSCVGGPPIREMQHSVEDHSMHARTHHMPAGRDHRRFNDPSGVQDNAGHQRFGEQADEAVFELDEVTMNDEVIAKELQADEAHAQEALDQMIQEDRIARQLLEERKKSPQVNTCTELNDLS